MSTDTPTTPGTAPSFDGNTPTFSDSNTRKDRIEQLERELAAVRAELENAKDNLRMSSVCRELRAEVENLRADKERLDWLATPLGIIWFYNEILNGRPVLRVNIDAARRTEGKA